MSAARRLVEPTPWTLDLEAGLPRPIDPQCVGVTAAMDSDRMLHFAITQDLRHVVQKTGFAFDQEFASADALVRRPELLRQSPVCAILSPHEVTPEREAEATLVDFSFTSSRQKREVMAGVNEALGARGIGRSLIEDSLSVTDELFTNAIYNAPFVDLKSGANPGVSRTDPSEIRYSGNLKSRLIVAADADRLLVGCADPFGSLNLGRYLHRIKETYVRGPAATMNFGPGGAGLGSYIIFNTGASLYFGVWPGRATVLFCVMPLGLSLRKRDVLPKHLHWIKG